MALISGKLKDLVGAVMASRKAELRFRINGTNVYASGSQKGRIIPTAPYVVIPAAADGAFSIDLPVVSTLLAEAWYILEIHWLDGQGGVTDFPAWQIRVTGAGDISDAISLGPAHAGSGANLTLIWLSLTEPRGLRKGQLWWKTDPNNPTNPANTGRIYRGL